MKIFCFLQFSLVFLLFQPEAKANNAGFNSAGQPTENYWVFFADKDGVSFNPYEFFHSKAIERRLRHGQDLNDPLDFPVREDYLAELAQMVDSIDVVLRWFNAASVFATPNQLSQIKQLPFVTGIEPMVFKMLPAQLSNNMPPAGGLNHDDLQLVMAHTGQFTGSLFRKAQIDGHGVRIAIFDAGFPGVDEHPAFSHILREGRVVATRDFVRNQQYVFHKNSHGTSVMSLIGGMIDSIPLGLATGADFLLARTETWTEFYSEEKNWLAAVEWADRLGADIINSSLGYIHHRYFPENMDGSTSLVARAAALAYQKGILVVNAAGNEGTTNRWKIIGTPADAAEVLSVGALEFPQMIRSDYSSRGPTADGRIKPNVSALGSVYAASAMGYEKTQGTSFASPLVAGFAACVWQMNPDWTNQQVFEAIENSARLYPYYDYVHGYGVPQSEYFFTQKHTEPVPTFRFEADVLGLQVKSLLKTLNEISGDLHNHYVYYQIRDVDGRMLEYSVVLLEQCDVLKFNLFDFIPGQKIIVHLAGYTATWEF
jgi:subtilisin family serine protease